MAHPLMFKNEPILDFSQPEVRNELKAELVRVRNTVLGRKYFPLINGNKVRSDDVFVRENPSKISEVVGYIAHASTEDADRAVECAVEGQRSWRDVDIKERVSILFEAARRMKEQKYFFIALMMLEVGKGREDAAGEFAEAVDFLEYYARLATWIPEMAQSTIILPDGEENTLTAVPKGVGVSIQPWNFPLAISVGPMAAALVMGNAVIYKPAEESSVIGFYITKLLHEAGVPKDVLQYLPGKGEIVGSHLVEHDNVDFVAFTGSLQVGMAIQREVAGRKTEIAAMELGGKGVMFIDSDAELDKAIEAVSESAFSFQGQKCSACSRVLIHGDIYEKFIVRLKNKIDSMCINSPENAAAQIGPVVSEEARIRIEDAITRAGQEGTILAQGRMFVPTEQQFGHFVVPTLVGNISHDSRTAQEEIFGPVLTAFKVKDLDEAIRLANDTPFGLTAGIFSRNYAHKKRFVREVDAGNIYINQKITGAIVARQPFGGLKASGDGTKAGGPFYLLRFTNWKSVSEDTVSYGLASTRK